MDGKFTAEDRRVLVFIQWYGVERGGRRWQQPQVQGMPIPGTVEGGDSNTPLWSSVSLCIHFPEISHTVLSVINSFHVQVEPVPFALVAVPVTHVCQ